MADRLVMPSRVSIALIALMLLSGCGRRAEAPLERAGSLFANSQFREASKVCDEALRATEDPEESAALHQLRGRCLIEEAHRLRIAEQNDAAEGKLKQAIEALTDSLDCKEAPEALYFRSMAHRMLGDEQRSLVDEARAKKIDPEYQTAWTNEPVEEPLDLKFRTDNSGTDDEESAPTEDRSTQDVATTESDASPRSGLLGSAEEAEDVTADSVSSPTSRAGSQTAAAERNPSNRTRSAAGGAPEYRGQPASEGSLSIARSASEFSSTPWRPGQPTPRQMTKETEGSEAERDSEGTLDEGEATEQEETASEPSADSKGEPPSERPSRPRPNVIWSPAIAPWSPLPQSTGLNAMPTTGIGGGVAGNAAPFSPIITPSVPTTGLGGAVLRMPWQAAAGGATANPFAPPTPFGPGTGFPRAGAATTPRVPQAQATPPITGPAGWPQQPVGAPVPPTFGPGPTPQGLPTTGVQRTVSPFPQ